MLFAYPPLRVRCAGQHMRTGRIGACTGGAGEVYCRAMVAEKPSYVNTRWPEAEWDVSGAFVNDRELLAFYDFCQSALGMEPFHLVHGAPLCTWNSGRVLKQLLRTGEEMRAAGLAYEQRSIAVYLTFSNLLLEEKHMKDVLGNALCTFFSRHNPTGRNGVIVAHEGLARHIRQEFPTLRRISSILNIVNNGGKGKLEVYQRLAEQYDEVMVHPDDVLNTDLLSKLEDKDRYICLINEYCIRNCPLRPYHYKSLSEESLNFLSYDGTAFDKKQMTNGCRDIQTMLTDPAKGVLALSTPEIQRLYDMGYRHFKLQGRGNANASGILFDLIRLVLRNDEPGENDMHAVVQHFWEHLTEPPQA